MAETRMSIVYDEVKKIVNSHNLKEKNKISHYEIEVIAKYLNKIVVTFENKHLIFCKKLKDDIFFIKGYKNVTLAQLDKNVLSQNFFIKGDFKNIFFRDILEKDNLFSYLVIDKKYLFNGINRERVVDFIGLFRNELVIESLDWFFFELPDYLIKNYSCDGFDFRE